MSKIWNPGRKTVELRPAQAPSRIRREPVRDVQRPEKLRVRSDTRDMWFGMSGVVLTAIAMAVLVLGIGIITVVSAADARNGDAFKQCYNAEGTNCVLDGRTIFVEREKVTIAGIDTPRINDAACSAERDRGIAAALALSNILRSGEVTISPQKIDEYGRAVQKVEVAGNDVAGRMIAAHVARPSEGLAPNWCQGASAD
ncbi:MAG: thermonuclease family protein [Sphingomicrobium sp.]